MLIFPKELPELRHEIFAHPEMPRMFHDLTNHSREVADRHGYQLLPGQAPNDEPDKTTTALGHALRDGDLHYVSGRFCELTIAAAPTLPRMFVAEHDIPSRCGVMYFDKPFPDPATGLMGRWIAVWGTTCDPDERDRTNGVLVYWLVDRDTRFARTGAAKAAVDEGLSTDQIDEVKRVLPKFSPCLCLHLPFETEFCDVPHEHSGNPMQLDRYLLTVWNLQRQKLTSTRVVCPDRASARRLARAGDLADSSVRVINLRATERDEEKGRPVTDREFHHQWVVRGHWRQHWYPSIQDNRPIWIAPYIKGPEGAPLLGGEKVYAWTR